MLLRSRPSCFIHTFRRPSSCWSLCRLNSKSVLELEGNDSFDYLQGLLTNDIHKLSSEGNRCLFAFMLSHLGRIIADLFVYKTSDSSLLIESDTRVVSTVYKHLLIHKLKRQLLVKKRDDLKVWIVHPSNDVTEPKERKIQESSNADIVSVNDPRVPSIPVYRFISNQPLSWTKLESVVNSGHDLNQSPRNLMSGDESIYTEFRYKYGLAEGASDHLTGSSFPLESNGDYTNAISFSKGCYVGQELTARTYHTGVTRKRLMPISLPGSDSSLVQGIELKSKDGTKRIGKVRGIQGSSGLALIYLEEAMKQEWKMYPVTEQEIQVIASRPFWWPTNQ